MKFGATYIIVLILLAVSACSRSAPDGEPLRDDLDRIVDIQIPVSRVATLAPSLTEMVYAVGAGDRLVGAGIPDNYPLDVTNLPRYSTYPIDFEALAALEPELVLATSQVNSPRAAETLAGIDIPTFFLAFASLDDVYGGMETIGRLLGTEGTATAATDSLRRRVSALRAATEPIVDRPTVLFLIGRETLFSFGIESYVHELIDLAGGRSLTRDVETAAPILSDEFVLTRAPDVIIGPWGHNAAAEELLVHHPTWTDVPAVRNGRVYGIDADLIERPGPRLVDGAFAMANLLHPNLSPIMSPSR